MNLAEATAQLRQKESEKMTCVEEISKLENAQFDGSLGSITVSVQNVKDPRKDSFSFVITIGSFKSERSSLLQEMCACTIMNDDKEIRIDAIVPTQSEGGEEESQPSEEGQDPVRTTVSNTYRCHIDVKSLPSDTFLQTEVDAVNVLNEQDKIVLVIKVAFTKLEDQIVSKKNELEQIYKEMEVVKEAIKSRPGGSSGAGTASSSAAKSSSATKQAKTKKSTSGASSGKGKKASSAAASSAPAANMSAAPVEPSESSLSKLTSTVAAGIVTGGALALKHYSVPLFAVATAAIYYYGDYASV
jgi:hypothetical protein